MSNLSPATGWGARTLDGTAASGAVVTILSARVRGCRPTPVTSVLLVFDGVRFHGALASCCGLCVSVVNYLNSQGVNIRIRQVSFTVLFVLRIVIVTIYVVAERLAPFRLFTSMHPV